MKLKEGDMAPEFTSRDADGNEVSLADFRGQNVLLYFYPKDDTPGCTAQACAIRDAYPDYEQRGIKVLGISLDTGESHQAFASKYDLPFTLLADTEHQVAEMYDVYGEHKYGDQTFLGVARKSFLINGEGRIIKIFDKVDVQRHSDQVLAEFAAA